MSEKKQPPEVSALLEARRNVSIKSPEHLKRWLVESRRRFLVFNSIDLVDALPFPAGHESLMQFIDCYRDHRSLIPSGRTEEQTVEDPTAPAGKRTHTISVPKTDTLELNELDAAIRELVGKALEIDPSWSLENEPL